MEIKVSEKKEPKILKKEDLDNLKKDIEQLKEKYNLREICFGALYHGEEGTNPMFSLFNHTQEGYMNLVALTGRLWQSVRENTKKFLDKFEGKW